MGKFDLNEETFGKKRSGIMKTAAPDVITKPIPVPTKMMNIRFTMDNAQYLQKEGALRGLSATAFVNWIVEQYRSDPKNVHESDIFRNEEKW